LRLSPSSLPFAQWQALFLFPVSFLAQVFFFSKKEKVLVCPSSPLHRFCAKPCFYSPVSFLAQVLSLKKKESVGSNLF
jgi:hypothetical protein